KWKTKSKNNCQDGSTLSEDIIEASTLQEIQEHKTNTGDMTIDIQTKVYIDAIIRSTAAAIMKNT
ncbi:13510_t:CDS:1, partial [Gigaspora rosea]